MKTYPQTTPVSTREHVEAIVRENALAAQPLPLERAADLLDRLADDVNRLAANLPACEASA
jgi:hypothetical protein